MLTTLSSATEFNLPSIQPNSQRERLFIEVHQHEHKFPGWISDIVGAIKALGAWVKDRVNSTPLFWTIALLAMSSNKLFKKISISSRSLF